MAAHLKPDAVSKLFDQLKAINKDSEISQKVAKQIHSQLTEMTKAPGTLTKVTTGITTLSNSLAGNAADLQSGDAVKTITAVSNISGAMCAVIPPPYGEVGVALFSCVSMLFGLASTPGPSQTEIMQNMINKQTDTLMKAINKLQTSVDEIKKMWQKSKFEDAMEDLVAAVNQAKKHLFSDEYLSGGGRPDPSKMLAITNGIESRRDIFSKCMFRLKGAFFVEAETTSKNDLMKLLKELSGHYEDYKAAYHHLLLAAACYNDDTAKNPISKLVKLGRLDAASKADANKMAEAKKAYHKTMSKILDLAPQIRTMIHCRYEILEMYFLLAHLNRLIIIGVTPLKAKTAKKGEKYDYHEDLKEDWLSDASILSDLKRDAQPFITSWVDTALTTEKAKLVSIYPSASVKAAAQKHPFFVPVTMPFDTLKDLCFAKLLYQNPQKQFKPKWDTSPSPPMIPYLRIGIMRLPGQQMSGMFADVDDDMKNMPDIGSDKNLPK